MRTQVWEAEAGIQQVIVESHGNMLAMDMTQEICHGFPAGPAFPFPNFAALSGLDSMAHNNSSTLRRRWLSETELAAARSQLLSAAPGCPGAAAVHLRLRGRG